MKKILILFLLASMLLSLFGCAAQDSEAAPQPVAEPTPVLTPTQIPEPTSTPEPEWEPGKVRADYGLHAKNFVRGDSVSVLGQWGDYYIVSDGSYELLVETRFVLLSTELFESYEAYFNGKGEVYASAHLLGDPVADLSTNTKLQVLAGKDGWLYVEWEEGCGYISEENISTSPIQFYYGGGGGGADGGDIQLSAGVAVGKLEKLSSYVGPKYTPMGKVDAIIGSDETEAYYIVFARGDEVRVTRAGEENCQLLLGETLMEVPRWLLQLGSDTPYTMWEGFSEHKAKLFKDCGMAIELSELEGNTNIKVLDVLDDCYIVEVDGQLAYMALDQVSEEKVYIPYYGGSGGGGGDWTAPVL